MSEVVKIRLLEQIHLDETRLGTLYAQLGENSAESVVCRAMEELAVRMAQCDTLWRAGHFVQLRKHARSLIAIADQIGMHCLAQVARDVTNCIDAQDDIAVAATLSRLLRTGEQSLSAIWSLDDPSI